MSCSNRLFSATKCSIRSFRCWKADKIAFSGSVDIFFWKWNLGELDSSAQFRRAFPSKVLIAENLRVSAWTFSEWVAHYGKFRYHATFPLRLQVTKKTLNCVGRVASLSFPKTCSKQQKPDIRKNQRGARFNTPKGVF